MWDKLQLANYVLLLAVAVWAFAATYEPLRSRALGRPISRRVAITIRVTAGLCAVLTLVILLVDIFR